MAEPEKQAADGPSWVKVGEGAHDRTLEENWLFRVRKERFQSRHSGKTHDFYVIHLADAVHAVALTPDDEVLLVRQFRAGSGRDSLEIPGGLVDPGEDPCGPRPRAARGDGLRGRPAGVPRDRSGPTRRSRRPGSPQS